MSSLLHEVSKSNAVWRYPYLYQDHFGVCDTIKLNPGLIISTSPDIMALIGDESVYQAMCSRRMLLLSSLNGYLESQGVDKLPLLENGWNSYIETEYQFIFTIYPIVYSLSCCTFITCFLCIIIFTKQYLRSQKPTMLIKMSSLLACLFLISIFIFSMVHLYHQHEEDVSSADLLLTEIQSLVPFNVVDIIIVILLQLSQVQIIMRLFPRQKEKRFAFLVGLFLSISSQAIWSVSTFAASNDRLGTDPDYDSPVAILPAFVYLLRIAMSMLFSCLVVVYFFNKRQFIFNRKVLPLTLFTFIVMNASFAIFIADISNIWVSELSELFNITSYVVTDVVTWEFINRVVLLEKMQQKRGILGRQFYDEEDQYYFDSYGNAIDKNTVIRKGKYDLIISSHEKNKKPSTNASAKLDITDSDYQTSSLSQYIDRVTSKKSSAFDSKLSQFTRGFNDFTDHVIGMSLSVPMRGGSSLLKSSFYDTDIAKPSLLHGFLSKRFGRNDTQSPSVVDATDNPRVYIYQEREIKVDTRRHRRLMDKTRTHKSTASRRNESGVNHHAQVRFQLDENSDNDAEENSVSDDGVTDLQDDLESRDSPVQQEEEVIYDDGSYYFDEDSSLDNVE